MSGIYSCLRSRSKSSYLVLSSIGFIDCEALIIFLQPCRIQREVKRALLAIATSDTSCSWVCGIEYGRRNAGNKECYLSGQSPPSRGKRNETEKGRDLHPSIVGSDRIPFLAGFCQ